MATGETKKPSLEGAGGSTRLHRLITLLETGSSPVTRRTAGRQIGEIAKQQTFDLRPLLRKLSRLLRSKNWDTRVAAAQAIGAIAESACPPKFAGVVSVNGTGATLKEEEGKTLGHDASKTMTEEQPPAKETCISTLEYSSFDIQRVLDHGAPLLASQGQEYDLVVDTNTSMADRLAAQQKNLRRRLGLEGIEQFVDVSGMIREEDLLEGQVPAADSGGPSQQKHTAEDIVASMMPAGLERSLSARERNRLKRKAKVVAKEGRVGNGVGDDVGAEPEQKRMKSTKTVVTDQGPSASKLVVESVVDEDAWDGEEGFEQGKWALEWFVNELTHDIFDPVWEVRHGSGMALREILSSLARGKAGEGKSRLEGGDEELREEAAPPFYRATEAGRLTITEVEVKKVAGAPQRVVGSTATGDEVWSNNSKWLEDLAIRLLCIFCLDRFGDYVTDQVVAPVRETCAQALGAVVKQMPSPLVLQTLNALLLLHERQEWQVRHGSLLGMKYLVAVRPDMTPQLLPKILPASVAGLQDVDDDVRAVAAEALTPAATVLASRGQELNVDSIISLLWDILLDLDDLSPSTSSVMRLLAELYSQPGISQRPTKEHPALTGLDLNQMAREESDANLLEVRDEMGKLELAELAPRLWPFMRHNISAVRHAAIRTLERLLEVEVEDALPEGRGVAWLQPILVDALRLVYQNLLLETDSSILESSDQTWRLLLRKSGQGVLVGAASGHVASWLRLAATPSGTSFDSRLLFTPRCTVSSRPSRGQAAMLPPRNRGGNMGPPKLGAGLPRMVVGTEGEGSATRMRVAATSALGLLVSHWPQQSLGPVTSALSELLSSNSGVQRQVAAMVIAAWFKEARSKAGTDAVPIPPEGHVLSDMILALLGATDPNLPTPGSTLPYAELARTYAKMREEAGAVLRHAAAAGVSDQVFGSAGVPAVEHMAVEQAIQLAADLEGASAGASHDASASKDKDKARGRLSTTYELLESARQNLLTTANYLKLVQSNLHISVLASMAGAVAWMGALPAKVNPVLQPLMAAIKREREEPLQRAAAVALAQVVGQCLGRKPSPNDRLIKNICSLTCADSTETPLATEATANGGVVEEDLNEGGRHRGTVGKGTAEDKAKEEGFLCRRGAERALAELAAKFGENLFQKLPRLWDILRESLGQALPGPTDSGPAWLDLPLPALQAEAQALVNNLQLVRSSVPCIHVAVLVQVLSLLPAVFSCVRHPHAAVRLAAARCLASLAKTSAQPTVLAAVLSRVVPMLGDAGSVEARRGAAAAVGALVDSLGPSLVPYAAFFLVPLLRTMADPSAVVREAVTQSFAALVPLLPLARGVPVPEGLGEMLAAKGLEDAHFLEQLLDNRCVDDYVLAVPIHGTLRRYQQEGINWLAFLKRFKLHGILCDDMGLGKTLQATSIMASDAAERAAEFAKSGSPDVAPLPSLVICPSTLVGHWAFEIEKFVDSNVLQPFAYLGSASERERLSKRVFDGHTVVVLSYETVRRDVDLLEKQPWNYCVLDEGHIIKSSKSKITQATKRIRAEHRLMLSGTPIQNNALELWSLFDFLMPGFLGSEKQFQARYGKPLAAARDPKCSAAQAEAGALAVEALHRQVMPFLLRRTKEEVLADLPPKIIQDRYCELSPLQLRLYENFSRSHARKEACALVEAYGASDDTPGEGTSQGASTHVFQALQYLRKLCSHPLLVLEGSAPPAARMAAAAVVKEEAADPSSPSSHGLHDLHHSPKLLALRDILLECGIGTSAQDDADSTMGHHRVLVFAQLKAFLDIIERDLFHTHMPGVTYLRLDGGVEASKRFEVVKTFNADPTIDVLLLTTHVGGLGLNLTSADTVVFMEHDWNPMRDLQAMDRAHRLGQKRTVNVHRLIMRGTLEEKVMGLQRFKLSIANTVINAENASLNSMDTTQLLDLFAVGGAPPAKVEQPEAGGEEDGVPSAGKKGLKAILSGLEELWDETQYKEEYDLNNLLAKLG